MEEIDWDNLPPTTAPPVSVRVIGFSNTEAATELGTAVGECVTTLGSFIDLTTLDGVTIGFDYDEALARVDRGMEGLPSLGRTNTEELQGVAKTCSVVRDGEVKRHLVFSAAVLVPLIAGEASTEHDRQSSIGIIAHECAHVEIGALHEAHMPDARLGARIADFERAILFQIAEICWAEYAVCRLSARFARRQNAQHAATVLTVIPEARARAKRDITAYRLHGDVYRLLGEAGSELCQPVKAVAYLLGGMDAEGQSWADYPQVRQALEEADYAGLADVMHEHCQSLWESRSKWSEDRDVLAPLLGVARDVFSSGGIFFYQDQRGEWGVSVPFTADTMPS